MSRKMPLPLPARPARRRAFRRGAGAMLKLLIVDDEALVRDGIALALKRECPGELAIL